MHKLGIIIDSTLLMDVGTETCDTNRSVTMRYIIDMLYCHTRLYRVYFHKATHLAIYSKLLINGDVIIYHGVSC